MKKYKYIAGIVLGMVAVVLCSCNDLLDGKDNPYEGTTRELINGIFISVTEGHPDREGGSARVTLEDVDRGTVYTASAGNDDMARFEVAFGIYRVSARDRVSEQDAVIYFNGARDQMIVSAASDLSQPVNIPLVASKTSQIVIKEVYCGGCKKDPLEGTYQSDKYVILYNNSEKVAYLDNICFGTVDPYNAYGMNVWLIADPETGEKSFRDYVPLVECVWGFPGGGTDYPLEPGGQAVMCINGAIDHTLQYPLSVDLNRADCFVCYDNTYYTNTFRTTIR